MTEWKTYRRKIRSFKFTLQNIGNINVDKHQKRQKTEFFYTKI